MYTTLSLRYKGYDLQGLDLQGVKHLIKIRVDLPSSRLRKVTTRVGHFTIESNLIHGAIVVHLVLLLLVWALVIKLSKSLQADGKG